MTFRDQGAGKHPPASIVDQGMTNISRAHAATSTLIESIERIDLRVTNLAEATEFYRDIVGFEVVEQSDHRATLGAPGGSVLLTLDSAGVDSPADRSATGLFHTAFRYPDRASLADALARLAGAGYPVGAGDHGVSEALYIDDPAGNGVELYRDRPRAQWPKPGPDQKVGMYTARVDLDALLEESNDPATGAPRGTEIGHVHLQVNDLEATLAFYVDGLGLDLMATMMGSAAFLSSGGYHHHIGANVWNSRGGNPPPKNRAGLDRVVFRVNRLDDLEQVGRRLGELGYEATADGEERVVRDPDGIELRFRLG